MKLDAACTSQPPDNFKNIVNHRHENTRTILQTLHDASTYKITIEVKVSSGGECRLRRESVSHLSIKNYTEDEKRTYEIE